MLMIKKTISVLNINRENDKYSFEQSQQNLVSIPNKQILFNNKKYNSVEDLIASCIYLNKTPLCNYYYNVNEVGDLLLLNKCVIINGFYFINSNINQKINCYNNKLFVNNIVLEAEPPEQAPLVFNNFGDLISFYS
jgi:hypothetical protein